MILKHLHTGKRGKKKCNGREFFLPLTNSILSTPFFCVPRAVTSRWRSQSDISNKLCWRFPADEVGERGVSWHHPHLQHREELRRPEALRHGDLGQPWKTRTGWDTPETHATSKRWKGKIFNSKVDRGLSENVEDSAGKVSSFSSTKS